MSLEENKLNEQAKHAGEAFSSTGREAELLQKVLRAVREEYDDQPAILKRTRDQFGSLERDLKSGRKSYLNLEGDLARLSAAIEDVEDSAVRATLKAKLAERQKEAAIAKGIDVTLNTLIEFGKIWANNQLAMQKITFANYQSGSTAFKTANDIASQQLTYLNEKIDVATNAFAGASVAVGIMFGPLGLGVAAVATGIGKVVGEIYKKKNEMEKLRLDIITTEADNLTKSFNSANNAGALFAGGMGEFRKQAATAGLTQMQFGKMLAENAESLRRFGGTAGGAIAKYSEANKLVMSKFGTQLMALGMSVDDIAAGTASYMGILGMAGNTQKVTAAEIAEGTKNWLKNIKAISMLTGEDAKKAQARAEKAALNSQIQGKLREEAGGDTKKFEALYTSFIQNLKMVPEELQLAFMQQRAYGIVTDKTARQEMAQSPAMEKYLFDLVELSKKPYSQKESEALLKKMSPVLLKELTAMGGTGMAAVLGKNFGQNAQLRESLIKMITPVGNMKKGETAGGSVEAAMAAAITDPLTKGITESMMMWQAEQIKIAAVLDEPLLKFADTMKNQIIPALEEALTNAGILGLFPGKVEPKAPKEIVRNDGTVFNPYEQNKQSGSIFDTTKKDQIKKEVEKLAKEDYLAWAKNVTLAPTAQLNGTDVATDMERAINAIALTSKSKVIINALDDKFHRSKAFRDATNTKDKDGNIISNPYFDKNGKPTDRNKHAMGLAADISMDGANKAMAAEINNMLKSLGIKATATFEAKGEGASTGDHIHIQEDDKNRTEEEKTIRNKKAKDAGAELASVDWDEHRDIQLAQLETMKRLADHLSDISNNTA